MTEDKIDLQLGSEMYKDLVSMAQRFYKASDEYMQSKRQQWEVRKSLYNNQMREETAIGDPLLFATIQTIISSLYNDKLTVTFKVGRDQGGKRADNLMYTASSDYMYMDKDIMDFHWLWDACFFGKGFKLMYGWDKKGLHTRPILLDPMHLIIDPTANSINGLNGRGSSRWFGWEEMTTKRELKAHPFYKNCMQDFAQDYENSLLQKDQEARDIANNLVNPQHIERFYKLEDDAPIMTWEMFIRYKGKMARAAFANNGTVVIGFQYIDKEFNNEIPVVERSVYPTKDFFGSSVCDFVEDKQRGRAKLQNLALAGVEYGVYGMYLADSSVDIDELATPAPNKIIRVKSGDTLNKLAPIQRQQVQGDVQYILDIMKTGAEQATGTPAIQQGMSPDTNRTATELATQRQSVDKRYSLTSKILGWSEKREWELYYKCIKVYMTSDDVKNVIVQGATGDYDLEIRKTDIIGEHDPIIIVESQEISEAKRAYELQVHSNLLSQIIQYPNANLRYGFVKLAKLSGYNAEETSLLLPPTPDEIHARMENESLSKGIYVDVALSDDHIAHKTEHESAEDTPELRKHIRAHDRAQILAKRRPELLPAEASTAQQPNQAQEAVAVGSGEAQPQMDYKQGFPNKV